MKGAVEAAGFQVARVFPMLSVLAASGASPDAEADVAASTLSEIPDRSESEAFSRPAGEAPAGARVGACAPRREIGSGA